MNRRPIGPRTPGSLTPGSLALLALVFGAASCSKPGSEGPIQTGRTDTLRVLVTDALAPLAEEHAREFMQRNDYGDVEVVRSTTRGALVALLADSATLAYADRPLNAEEQGKADLRGGARLPLRSTRIASGALVAVVHPSNGLAAVTRERLAGLVRGQASGWGAGGPAGAVQLAVTGVNSGTYELAARTFFPGAAPLAPASVGATEADVLRFVAARPNALGLVSLGALHDSLIARGAVRTLAVSDSGRPAVVPSPLAVYRGTYPLRHAVYAYHTGPLGSLEGRFAAFAADRRGQTLVQRFGLVPATIPARTIDLVPDV